MPNRAPLEEDPDEVRGALERALRLYERKGDLVGAARVRRQLA